MGGRERAGARAHPQPTCLALERAAALFRGPLLDGFGLGEAPFDEWLEAQRTRLHEAMLGALERLAELQAADGSLERALETALHALRLEPLQERAHRAIMRLYAQQGRRAEAIQHYEQCAAMLARELGVEPDEHRCAPSRSRPARAGTCACWVSRCIRDRSPRRASAYLAQQQPERAREIAAQALAQMQAVADPLGLALVRRVQAMVAMARGDFEQAAARVGEACQRFQAMGARLERALTGLAGARIATLRGDRQAAARELALSEQTFAALALPRWLALVRERSARGAP